MTSVPLKLFFYGLIAFVHDRPQDGYMSSYMVSSDHHLPVLAFELDKDAGGVCPKPEEGFGDTFCFEEPEREKPWCFCFLTGPASISFDPASVAPNKSIAAKPVRKTPGNKKEADDFPWLIRMSNIVDDDSAKAKPDNMLGRRVRTQMSFRWQDAQTCHLDQVLDEDGKFRIHPFRFVRRFAEASGSFVHEQALSEYAKFDLSFPTYPVKLLIAEQGGSGRIEINLGCRASGCPDVLLANIATSMCHEQEAFSDVGFHFASYYDLSQGTPEMKVPVRLNSKAFTVPSDQGGQLYTCGDDPLRRRRAVLSQLADMAKQGLEAEDFNPRSASGIKLQRRFDKAVAKAVDTRIICPMAMFDP